MRNIFLLSFVLTFWAGLCFADEGDDTLKYYLSKSGCVVLGTILSEPTGTVDESGVVNYYCDVNVVDVCKGTASLKDKTVYVNIIRFEMGLKDHNPLIKKDSVCILFLKKNPDNLPVWVTADFWFGVQYPSPLMVISLKRLAEIEKKNTKP